MNREIKFRSWSPDKKSMMRPGSLEMWFGGIAEMGVNPFMASPNEIFMQYTGLKDKNGIEIYEGDILKENTPTETEDHMISIVTYHEGYFSDETGDETLKEIMERSACEVIGNIFENKDLILKLAQE